MEAAVHPCDQMKKKNISIFELQKKTTNCTDFYKAFNQKLKGIKSLKIFYKHFYEEV